MEYQPIDLDRIELVLKSNVPSIEEQEWREKFKPILADTTKANYGVAYILTRSSIKDVVEQIDTCLAILDADKGKVDIELVNRIMITEGRAKAIKQKIAEALLIVEFFEFWGEEERKELLSQIPLTVEYHEAGAQSKGKASWEEYYFQDVPLIAVVTLLNKLKKDALASCDIIYQNILDKARD